ncbi:MAG: hypothetical protein KIT34_11530 [Cyanobacteria bacterium TGS_CYA1]|nr:hypothetical protein [Cyanobacteria bacterium TGS_CYA1]
MKKRNLLGLFIYAILPTFALGWFLAKPFENQINQTLADMEQYEIAENFMRFRHIGKPGPHISDELIVLDRSQYNGSQNWNGQFNRNLTDATKKQWLEKTSKMTSTLCRIYGDNSLELARHYEQLGQSALEKFDDSLLPESLESKARDIYIDKHCDLALLRSLHDIANYQQIQDFEHEKLPETLKEACRVAAKCNKLERDPLVISLYSIANDSELTKNKQDLRKLVSDQSLLSDKIIYPNDYWLGDEVIKISEENKVH